MNRIDSINFGEVILSNRLRKAMKESQENPNELNHFKDAKADCYIDLRCTKTGNYYLQAVETWENGGINNHITERLKLNKRRIPYVSDLLMIYDKFQQSVERRNKKFFDDISSNSSK